jgi:hypothetical protein
MGFSGGCADFSRTAVCCSPDISETIEIENPKLESYRDALEEYIKNPRCKVPLTFEKRGPHSLAKRELKYPMDVTQHILLALLAGTMGGTMNEMVEDSWNDAMGTRFSNLHFPAFRDYVSGVHTFAVRGPIELASGIVCNLSYWNKMASNDKKEKTLVCYDPKRCVGDECFPDDADDDSIVARQVGSGSSFGAFHHHRHAHRHMSGQDSQKRSGKIEKRSRDYTASFMGTNGRTFTITVTTLPVCLCLQS